MDKKEFRKIYLEKRNKLTTDEITYLSSKISYSIFEHEYYKTANTIFTYVNLNTEVITTQIINKALNDSKNVAVPVITSLKHEIIFIKINSLKNLKTNKFGILEPPIENQNIITSDKNTLVLIPALVFSTDKYRIGYGGGYYDNYLNNNISFKNIGICYDFQVANSIPHEKFDKKVDLIITDKRIIY